MLLQWLNNTKAQHGFSGTVSHCVVPIAHDPDNIPTQALQMALQVPTETLVLPVRVVWKTQFDGINGQPITSKPKFRDLLRGNSRLPNKKKAQKIIDSDPSRALCILGKPATAVSYTHLTLPTKA